MGRNSNMSSIVWMDYCVYKGPIQGCWESIRWTKRNCFFWWKLHILLPCVVPSFQILPIFVALHCEVTSMFNHLILMHCPTRTSFYLMGDLTPSCRNPQVKWVRPTQPVGSIPATRSHECEHMLRYPIFLGGGAGIRKITYPYRATTAWRKMIKRWHN